MRTMPASRSFVCATTNPPVSRASVAAFSAFWVVSAMADSTFFSSIRSPNWVP
jgi:hypothetical protein